MARTSTEFQMKDGILEAIHNYLTGQGYSLGELNGCHCWMRSDFLGNCYYIQFCDMGDKFILDEWLEGRQTTEEYPIDSFSLTGGVVLSQFAHMKKHQNLISYIKSL